MKKFKFQLETLLKVTRMKKEEAEVAFAEAVRHLEDARAYQRQLLEEMHRGQLDYENLSKEGTRYAYEFQSLLWVEASADRGSAAGDSCGEC